MSDILFPHLKRLLICTDGSQASQGAINAGLQLGNLSGAKVYLLNVQKSGEKPQETALRDSLGQIEAKGAETGIDLEVRIRPGGLPYEGILEEAKTVVPNWLIMGRKGLTGLRRLLIGSVATRVIAYSACSVLVVPRNAFLAFRKILVASDGSPDSEAAWREAILLAERVKCEVIGLSVARDKSREMDCTLFIQHLQASAARHSVSFQGKIATGRPFEVINEAVQEEQADLVVMGTHGRTGFTRLLLGSVTERVIGTVQCPVLVVKHKMCLL